MSCKEYRRLLGLELDGRLSEQGRRALTEHLQGCAACRAEQERWQQAAQVLRGAPQPETPAGLAERSWRAALNGSAGPAAQRELGAAGGWFVAVARRAVLAGALAMAGVWGGLLLVEGLGQPAQESTEAATYSPDPVEIAVSLWATEVTFDHEQD